ncbi:MAG: hypothetical protein ACOZDY_03175, partial [Pseudomonadota bacterium]
RRHGGAPWQRRDRGRRRPALQRRRGRVLIRARTCRGAIAVALALPGAVPAVSAQPAPGAQSAPRVLPPYFLLNIEDQRVLLRVMRPAVEPLTPVFSGSLTGNREVDADGIVTLRVRGTGRVGIGLNVIDIGEQGVSVKGAPLLEPAATLNPDGTLSPGAGSPPPR